MEHAWESLRNTALGLVLLENYIKPHLEQLLGETKPISRLQGKDKPFPQTPNPQFVNDFPDFLEDIVLFSAIWKHAPNSGFPAH